MSEPFTMSIETTEGNAYQHGYHLGTHEDLAKSIVRETYYNRVKHRLPVVTIALMRSGAVVDVFMGDQWQSEI